MPMKAGGSGDLREIDWFEADDTEGFGWIAHPSETMRRASHALATDAGVLVVDPVDVDGVDDRLADLGEVAAVVVLLDRHERGAAAVAERHGVSVYAPAWMDGVTDADGRPAAPLVQALDGTGYGSHPVVDNPLWQEAALHHPASGTLVVPEALGTASYFRTADERVGVHPMLRLTPPRSVTEYSAERLLVGHGEGVLSDAEDAIEYALVGARRRAPALYLRNLAGMLTG